MGGYTCYCPVSSDLWNWSLFSFIKLASFNSQAQHLIHWESLLKSSQCRSFSKAHSASPRRAGKLLSHLFVPRTTGPNNTCYDKLVLRQFSKLTKTKTKTKWFVIRWERLTSIFNKKLNKKVKKVKIFKKIKDLENFSNKSKKVNHLITPLQQKYSV